MTARVQLVFSGGMISRSRNNIVRTISRCFPGARLTTIGNGVLIEWDEPPEAPERCDHCSKPVVP